MQVLVAPAANMGEQPHLPFRCPVSDHPEHRDGGFAHEPLRFGHRAPSAELPTHRPGTMPRQNTPPAYSVAGGCTAADCALFPASGLPLESAFQIGPTTTNGNTKHPMATIGTVTSGYASHPLTAWKIRA